MARTLLALLLLSGLTTCITEPVPIGAQNASFTPAGDAAISPECGNGVLDEGEFCDDGGNDNCGTCNRDCSGPGADPPVCGDGDACGSEVCDDGFTDDCGTCNATCTGPGTGSTCGDGIRCPQTEVCDDGDLEDCNACDSTCLGPGAGSGCVAISVIGTAPYQEVLINGLTHEGECDRGAIAHWSTPHRYVVGFDACDGNDLAFATIRPSDGRILYQDGTSIREFHCDECPHWVPTDVYPPLPYANDDFISTPGCSGGISKFLVGPQGLMIHRCLNTGAWHDEAGTMLYDGSVNLIHLGYGHLALGRGGDWLVDLATRAETPVTGLPSSNVRAARARPGGGFWLAFVDGAGEFWDDWDLYEVDPSGTATHVVQYAAPPATTHTHKHYFGPAIPAVLDAYGNLYEIRIEAGSIPYLELIVRYDYDGLSSEVVYTEVRFDPVMLNVNETSTISFLFSGP